VPEGNAVRYFGHSPNFRIPARLNLPGETRAANPRDFVPAHLREKTARPGRRHFWLGGEELVEEKDEQKVRKKKVVGPPGQRAGRVFFSDARFESANGDLVTKTSPLPARFVRAKATTFQHYLVQDGQAGQNGHSPDNKAC
jgi:hypothetical protein